jgi:dipeptidyl aminopeptidase/acylaminoacyl peptidase
MATNVIDSPAFQSAWRGRPVLVISGEDDRNIPINYVLRRVEQLKAGGVQVALISYPGEDHFLFFTQRRDVSSNIVQWIKDH